MVPEQDQDQMVNVQVPIRVNSKLKTIGSCIKQAYNELHFPIKNEDNKLKAKTLIMNLI